MVRKVAAWRVKTMGFSDFFIDRITFIHELFCAKKEDSCLESANKRNASGILSRCWIIHLTASNFLSSSQKHVSVRKLLHSLSVTRNSVILRHDVSSACKRHFSSLTWRDKPSRLHIYLPATEVNNHPVAHGAIGRYDQTSIRKMLT